MNQSCFGTRSLTIQLAEVHGICGFEVNGALAVLSAAALLHSVELRLSAQRVVIVLSEPVRLVTHVLQQPQRVGMAA